MIFTVHAGHNEDGKTACGAIGILKESTENRKVKDEVIRLLKQEGHTVYDTTVNNASSQSNNLNQIVANCNKYSTSLDISIHFNSYNKSAKGTEVFVYNSTTKAKAYADRVVKKVSSLGYVNRGVKYSTGLAVLKTKNPCMLVECCFIDNKDDIDRYNYKTMAKAIVEGVLDKTISNTQKAYKLVTGGFGTRENAELKASYLKGLTGWNLEVKGTGDCYIEVNGFIGEDRAKKKLDALIELTGWWAIYELI